MKRGDSDDQAREGKGVGWVHWRFAEDIEVDDLHRRVW